VSGNQFELVFKDTSRQTDWRLVDRVTLDFDAHHPQGITRVGQDRFVLSTVEIITPPSKYSEPRDGFDRTPGRGRGWLIEFDRTGRKLRRIQIDDRESMYHLGGLHFDGHRIWCVVGEYRPDSQSVVLTVDPDTLQAHEEFWVKDHVGAVAHDTTLGWAVGVSWGSRRLYNWHTSGRLHSMTRNPSQFIDYQDTTYVGTSPDRSLLFCTGVSELPVPGGGRYELGGMALLELPSMTQVHAVPFPRFTRQNHTATYNATHAEIHEGRLRLYAVADDGDSELLIYDAF
jgi:hypothetical protein